MISKIYANIEYFIIGLGLALLTAWILLTKSGRDIHDELVKIGEKKKNAKDKLKESIQRQEEIRREKENARKTTEQKLKEIEHEEDVISEEIDKEYEELVESVTTDSASEIGVKESDF